MTTARELHRELERLLAARPPQAGSLAISLFGDCISQHGGSVWLASLVAVMAEFGLNPRQTRTALFRLVQDGWLNSLQIGRRSYYALSADGERQFARAAGRIYAAAPQVWDGQWLLLMTAAMSSAERDELRKRLAWIGFGVLANGLLAHPRHERQALQDTLEELNLAERTVVWQARPDEHGNLNALVREAWHLDELAHRFETFIMAFARVRACLADTTAVTDRDAFVVRSLLIHEYRRILLRTTDLPPALLPPDWPGHRATQLVAEIYNCVQAAGSRYACAVLSNADGPLPPPIAGFYARFAGLAKVPGNDPVG